MNNIGIDLDDVLADFKNGWLTYYNNKYKTNYKYYEILSYKFEKLFEIDRETAVKRIKHFYRTKIFEELLPINDAKTVLRKIEKYSSMFVITSRPLWLETKTKNWITKHFGDIFDDIILSNQFGNKSKKNLTTKAQICKDNDINIMIEDAPTYSKEVADTGVKVLLLDRPWNRNLSSHKNITRVKSWKEIESYISSSQNI